MKDKELKKIKPDKDLTGKKIGRWTVIRRADSDYVSPKDKTHFDKWVCVCDCGTQKEVLGSRLRDGGSLSCGCYKIELCKKANKYDLSGDYGVGYCSNTGSPFYFDLEDYDKIKDYCWHEVYQTKNYRILSAWNSDTKSEVKFHRVIGMDKNCDHINRNTLDNRKENLRNVTQTENTRNCSKIFRDDVTSKYIGVFLSSEKYPIGRPWRAKITLDGKRHVLGRFATEEEALIARLRAEKEYFGEFSPQKNLFEKYGI